MDNGATIPRITCQVSDDIIYVRCELLTDMPRAPYFIP